jgi:adenosylmethionine-8-amino-7-oxononanoate aminotransferase
MGQLLEGKLREHFGDHPHVGDIRGRGLFWGVELVQDRATRRPFDPARRIHARVKQAALKAGLLCYPMGGTVDGVAGDHLLLAPPFIIEPSHLEELAAKLAGALAEALINT